MRSRHWFFLGGVVFFILAIAAQAVAGEVCTVTITATCTQVTEVIDQYKGNHTEAQVRIDGGDVLPFVFDGDDGIFQVDVDKAKRVDTRGNVFADGRLVGTFHRTATFDQSDCDSTPTPPPTTPPTHAVPSPPVDLAFTGGGPNPWVAYPAVTAGALSGLFLAFMGGRAVWIRVRRTA